jgi:hypothetical protein
MYDYSRIFVLFAVLIFFLLENLLIWKLRVGGGLTLRAPGSIAAKGRLNLLFLHYSLGEVRLSYSWTNPVISLHGY